MYKINRIEWRKWVRLPSRLIRKKKDKLFISRRVVKIPLSVIENSQHQIRERFDEVAVATLADSIRRHGLLQPIVVKRCGNVLGERPQYTCVCGRRRIEAFRMLGWDEIPCLMVGSNVSFIDELALVENLARCDLDMFEYAAAFAGLLNVNACTEDDLASRLATSLLHMKHKLDLLSFTETEQMFILQNSLTEEHAEQFLRIEDSELRQKVVKLVADRQYTAKRTKEYIDIILSDLIPFATALDDNDEVESFGKSLSCSLNLLRKKGYPAQCESFEHEDEVQFLVRIPKR